MKKNVILSVLLVLVMLLGNAAFAGSDYGTANIPLASNQKVLFTLEEPGIEAPKYLYDLGYDRVKDHLYVIVKTGTEEVESEDEDGEVIELITTEQYVYSLETKAEVANPSYPLLPGYSRLGIEFEADQTWSVERPEAELYLLLNDFESKLIGDSASVKGKGFAIQGNQVLYYLRGCINEENFLVGKTDYSTELGEPVLFVDDENPIFGDLDYIKGYDLSADGEEIIFIGTEFIEDEVDDLSINVVVRVDSQTKQEIDRFAILPPDEAIDVEAYDLYTTEEHIVVLYKDWDLKKGYIERYTYDGVRVDGVETNKCVRKITEGPNGSTIYIQMRVPDDMDLEEIEFDGRPRGSLEVIQINWEQNSSTSSSDGPKPVIQERTRAGLTVARFTDHQFGLLRVEELETGIVDYRAPIRSSENFVKLQIPYSDIQAKLESGARNLLVEYQGQTLTFPMELFACDEILAAMPCQTDATIEIIMHTDEAGNVTYNVQLFVVEQVNGMTKVVHRKTIQ
jgi:hypothetical protein